MDQKQPRRSEPPGARDSSRRRLPKRLVPYAAEWRSSAANHPSAAAGTGAHDHAHPVPERPATGKRPPSAIACVGQRHSGRQRRDLAPGYAGRDRWTALHGSPATARDPASNDGTRAACHPPMLMPTMPATPTMGGANNNHSASADEFRLRRTGCGRELCRSVVHKTARVALPRLRGRPGSWPRRLDNVQPTDLGAVLVTVWPTRPANGMATARPGKHHDRCGLECEHTIDRGPPGARSRNRSPPS